MKKFLRVFLLAGALTALLCISAAAADATESGIYNVQVEDGYTETVTLEPQSADGSSITVNDEVYANAEKVQVTYTDAVPGSYYMVFALTGDSAVPTADNIAYMDQVTATGDGVTFTVYPNSLTPGETYSIYLSSNAGAGITTMTKVASFQYYSPYKLGDTDGNGTINVNDVMAVINHIAKKNMLTGNNLLAADVDSSGSVNINDAMGIINYITKKIDHFGD